MAVFFHLSCLPCDKFLFCCGYLKILAFSTSALAYITCGFIFIRSILQLLLACDEKNLFKIKGPLKFCKSKNNTNVFITLIFSCIF